MAILDYLADEHPDLEMWPRDMAARVIVRLASAEMHSAADVMYAPVASHFRTNVADLSRYGDDGAAHAYVATVLAMPEMAEWAEGAWA